VADLPKEFLLRTGLAGYAKNPCPKSCKFAQGRMISCATAEFFNNVLWHRCYTFPRSWLGVTGFSHELLGFAKVPLGVARV